VKRFTASLINTTGHPVINISEDSPLIVKVIVETLPIFNDNIFASLIYLNVSFHSTFSDLDASHNSLCLAAISSLISPIS
jgi:hypothetical protein